MTCLLNTFGRFSNLENIIKFLNKEETSTTSADNELFSESKQNTVENNDPSSAASIKQRFF